MTGDEDVTGSELRRRHLDLLGLLRCRSSSSLERSDAPRRLGFLLRVGLFGQGLDSVYLMSASYPEITRVSKREKDVEGIPSPVRLPLPVADEVDLGVEPLGALDAVVLAQARQVFSCVAVLVLGEVLGREEVGLDLVDVSAGGSVSRRFYS